MNFGKMKMMGIDLGLARTGISECDALGMLASPRTVIHEHNEQRLIEKIVECAKEIKPARIVVGLPLNMDGSKGERATECERIASIIGEQTGIEIVMWDERCTTVTAHNYLSMNNVRGKKRKQTVDAVAAVIILEDYLRSL